MCQHLGQCCSLHYVYSVRVAFFKGNTIIVKHCDAIDFTMAPPTFYSVLP